MRPMWSVSSSETSRESPSSIRSSSFEIVWEDTDKWKGFDTDEGKQTAEFIWRGTSGDLREFFFVIDAVPVLSIKNENKKKGNL